MQKTLARKGKVALGIMLSYLLISTTDLVYSRASAADDGRGGCSSHGGIDCNKGPHFDGHVYCNDPDWTSSSVNYNDVIECQVIKLDPSCVDAIWGRDEYLKKLKKMLSDYDAYLLTVDQSDPRSRQMMQNQRNYYVTLIDNQTQKYFVLAKKCSDELELQKSRQQSLPIVSPPSNPPVNRNYNYSRVNDLIQNPTINIDKQLPTATEGDKCRAGDLIRGSLATLYFCGGDGKRYVFPNERTYNTWYKNFDNITVINDSLLAEIPLGGIVTYRPGLRMIKIQSDPKVYAIARNGTLRWIMTEDIAVFYYGNDWQQYIDDISDAFFSSYKIGDPIGP